MLDEVTRNRCGVVARATRNDVYVLNSFEDVRRRGAERRLEQPAVGNTLLQGIGDRARLLVNLFQHEVAVLPLLGRIGGQLALANGPLDGVAVFVDDPDRLAPDLGDVALFEEHESPCDRQQRSDIGSYEVLLDAQADDDRATFTGQDETFRIVLTDNGQGIGAFELGHCRAHCLEQIFDRCLVKVDSVGNNLGVGFGSELIAETLQLVAKLLVILDDAVVDDRETVAGDVRVSVAFARDTVGCPTRMRNSDFAGGRRLLQGLGEHFDLADRAEPGQVLRAIEDGQARRVIAAILEPPQSLHQDGDDVALGDRSDDSAHSSSASIFGRGKDAKFASNGQNTLILLAKGVNQVAAGALGRGWQAWPGRALCAVRICGYAESISAGGGLVGQCDCTDRFRVRRPRTRATIPRRRWVSVAAVRCCRQLAASGAGSASRPRVARTG